MGYGWISVTIVTIEVKTGGRYGSSQKEDMKITVICHSCDHKLKFLLSTVKRKRVIYLGDDEAELGSTLITPKTYSVPCPNCGAENEVKLP
jgi:hypothetical protein